MNYNNVSLPYPVLGINDDVYPILEDDCIVMDDPVKTPNEYRFTIRLNQRNKKIAQLITSGQAEYACEVTCKDTFLRRCIHSDSSQFDFSLSRRSVKGRINFNCFVAVKYPIKGYSNEEFNEDYRGFTFDMEEGDLLVMFPQAYYNTDIKFDKLFAAGTFMQIVEAEEGVDKTWFNLDKNRILIELPHDLFEQYRQVGNSFPDIIHSSLVHNALVYALSNLGEYQDKGKLWADTLMQRLTTDAELQEYDLSDMQQIFYVADYLLQNPYKRLLDGLEKINDNLRNEQED